MLGAKITAPGARQIEVDPFLGDLDWAEGALATPSGPVKIKVAKLSDGKLKVDVSAPDGINVIVRKK